MNQADNFDLQSGLGQQTSPHTNMSKYSIQVVPDGNVFQFAILFPDGCQCIETGYTSAPEAFEKASALLSQIKTSVALASSNPSLISFSRN